MEATLIYNQQAGNTGQPGPDELLQALAQAGYQAVYRPTSTEEDLERVLDEARDLVVVAGGDGSVRAVAIRALGKEVRITPLPMGTANNIARTLQLVSSPLEIIAGLADPVVRDMDIGRVTTEERTYYFLEALGIGIFADGMKKYKPENGKSILRGLQSARHTLQKYQPKFFHLSLDGEDFSGSYLLVEVMNTPAMGLHYRLAPQARPDDGLFDLLLIHASQRENYLRFVAGVITARLEKFPEVSLQRGRRLEIAWRGFPLHLDGEVLDALPWDEARALEQAGTNQLGVAGPYLHVDLVPNAVHFMVPRLSCPQEGA